jgi:UDP-glucose 4-epimerase
MKRYLVTGGTGFIGSALVKTLVGVGHHVTVVDDASRGRWDRLGGLDGVVCCTMDVRDSYYLDMEIQNQDAVIHLAAVNGTRHFYEKPFEVLDVGVQGTLNVVRACRKYKIKELHVASSSEAYQTPVVVPTPEDVCLVVPDPTNPRYSYGGSKIISELLALHSGIERVTVFRPHNVYGPDMGHEHVIPELIAKAKLLPSSGGKLELKGSGMQTRAFCHIQDFVTGLITVLEKGNGIYNIGTANVTSITFLAAMILQKMGKYRVELMSSKAPEGETNVRCPDISKLRALGYEPQISLDRGLDSTIAWYLDHA